ncbi:MAG: peptidoglycan editing factor PgeF [Chromatiales bacterium]|nr:MAG: peptidoglycan editing factor PgeF [Chromatiales bacterium]
MELIRPDWPAPANVRALATARVGGVSGGPYASLNLGDHVGDATAHVAANRRRLRTAAGLPGEPGWLEQVHGSDMVSLPAVASALRGDGAMTDRAGAVCAVLTADCLPVLLCDRAGTTVAAVHAGWRSLAAGILDNAVAAFARAGIAAAELLAWLGPAIGPAAYEVGDEVRAAFAADADAPGWQPNARGRWQCDLYTLARTRLNAAGVPVVTGGGFCTHREQARFFSHRRDGRCGRQATLIWLEPA